MNEEQLQETINNLLLEIEKSAANHNGLIGQLTAYQHMLKMTETMNIENPEYVTSENVEVQ